MPAVKNLAVYLPLLLLPPLLAPATDIGMIHSLQIDIPGERLAAVSMDERAPALVRVEVLRETPDGYLYAIDFVALEPGEYDVMNYLRTAAGRPPDAPPRMMTVERKLPDTFQGEIGIIPRRVGIPPAWYKPTAWTFAVLWGLCLPALVFLKRKKAPLQVASQPGAPSLEERLKALLDGVGDDESKEVWQKLEATLIHYLVEARNVSPAKAFDQLLELKRDGTAGPVIRQFERCLHAPGGRRRAQLDRALAECARVLEGDS